MKKLNLVVSEILFFIALGISMYAVYAGLNAAGTENYIALAGFCLSCAVLIRFYKEPGSLIFYLLASAVYTGILYALKGGITMPLVLVMIGYVVALFMFRPKQRPVTKPQVRSLPRVSQPKKTLFLNRESRRYSLMVEKAWSDNGRHLSGTVHGEMKSGDTVVVISEQGQKEAVVAKLIKDGSAVDAVKDASAEVVLEGDMPVPLYAVVSSVMPGNLPDSAQENPCLLGMMYEYGRFVHDHAFMNRFIHVLVHSRYLVPVHIEENMTSSQMSTKISFMGVSRSKGDKMRSFAVFTDADALSRWKAVHQNGHAPLTMSITFQDAVTIMWKGHEGIVIDPFGPKFVFLSSQLIDQITKQDIYRKEFGAPGEHGLSFDPTDQNKKQN